MADWEALIKWGIIGGVAAVGVFIAWNFAKKQGWLPKVSPQPYQGWITRHSK